MNCRSFTAPRVLIAAVSLLSLLSACGSSPSSPSSAQAEASTGSDEPELAKSVVPRERPKPAPAPRAETESPPPPALSEPWSYVLPVDHGVRSDKGGQGGFLAPRYHGRHNGIDLLAPLGTPLHSPCDGKARAGRSRSFGRYVQVVCKLPGELVSGRAPYASLFYSHMSKTTPGSDFERVRRGQTVGAVGKTGNASGSDIAPHVHLEIIVHDDERDAEDETHSGRNQKPSRAASAFLSALDDKCLQPNGFKPKDSALNRARRLDPFVVLTCLAPGKPAYSRPRGSLANDAERWSEHYSARTFDVNVGRRRSGEQPTARR